jgi:hypothetical protein
MTSSESDNFFSAKLRLTRAEEHLNDLITRIDGFFSEKPYTKIAEPDPDGIHETHKIRLTKRFPFRWRVLATEVIEHARASLDHATWICGWLSTQNPNIEQVAFPFARTAGDLDNSIRRRSKNLPPEIQALLRSFQPYQGGNDDLFVLNDLCNLSKHALVTFMPRAAATGTISGTAFKGPIQFLEPFILDPFKNEIPYMRVLKGMDPKHDFDLAVYPLLDYREFTSEQPATYVLGALINAAGHVVTEIEAEARRIGLIK